MSKTNGHKEFEEIDLILERGVDVEARRIYLIQGIEPEASQLVIPAITYLNRKSATKPIEVWIESDGGDLESFLAMYDAFRLSKAPIHTVGTGQVASAAFILLASGDKRFATEHCIAMHHAPSSFVIGDGRELQAGTKSYKMVADKFYSILEQHSGENAKWWERKANREGAVWMETNELIDVGVIDEIYG